MQKINTLLTKVLSHNIIMMFIFVLLALLICMATRYEMLADLNNYHYYVAWALMNDRTFVDIAIGLENSYHNPLIELPTYYIINKFNDTPVVYQLYHSIYAGLLAFVFYLLVRLNFDVKTAKGKIQIFVTMLLAMTGFAYITQIGTSSNEIPVIFCIMTGLYLIYKEVFFCKTERAWIFLLAGVVMGAGLGLKFTVIIYCLSAGLTLMIFYRRLQTPFKTIAMFALGGILGFLLTYGWWGFLLYKEFGNPMYPYMNSIFKSPYYPEKFLTYSTYFEKNAWNWLVFPYMASFQGETKITSEAWMIDVRLAIGYTLLILFLVWTLVTRTLRTEIKNHQENTFLITFAVIGYVFWFYVFSIMRYAIPVEMIIVLMIVKFVSLFYPHGKKAKILYCVICLAIVSAFLYGLPYKGWGNNKLLKKVIDIEEVHLPKNSLLIAISGSTGLSATQIINQNPDTQLVNEVADFIMGGCKLTEMVEERKKAASYTAYLIVLRSGIDEFDRHTPVQFISENNKDRGFEDLFANLQYIIKHRLGVDNFYCRSINKGATFNKVFMCIDKKDKHKIFPAAEDFVRRRPNRRNTRFRRSIHQDKSLAF